MKINWKFVVILVSAVILVSNIFSVYIRTLLEEPYLIYAFETRNAEFRFIVDEEEGMDQDRMQREFQKYLQLHPGMEDRQLFRTFEMKPWKFWNWYHYLESDLYEYPYKQKE
jgi:hypothetical protein